jgi:hypothetical protein
MRAPRKPGFSGDGREYFRRCWVRCRVGREDRAISFLESLSRVSEERVGHLIELGLEYEAIRTLGGNLPAPRSAPAPAFSTFVGTIERVAERSSGPADDAVQEDDDMDSLFKSS